LRSFIFPAENSEGKKIDLQIQPQQKIIFIGENINLEGGIISAESGQIELASIGENNRINHGSTLDYSTALTFGDINLTQGSILDVDGEQQGEIRIQGRILLLTDGLLIDADNANTFGKDQGGSVNLNVQDSLSLSGSGQLFTPPGITDIPITKSAIFVALSIKVWRTSPSL